jgi:rhodanese-related sulfurtransferase
VDDLLSEARHRLGRRPGPAEVEAALADGALVVDIRPLHQRARDGEIPGSVVIDRNVLEWRLDPSSGHRTAEASYDRAVIVVCDEGYASTLAAATLLDLGLHVTDLAGGLQAWVASGRAIVRPADVAAQPGGVASTTESSSSP